MLTRFAPRRYFIRLRKASQLSLFDAPAKKPAAPTPASKPTGPAPTAHQAPHAAPSPAESNTAHPPAGFSPIPHSRHGGYHKRVGDRWVYWYPGQGIRHSAHQDDHAHEVAAGRAKAPEMPKPPKVQMPKPLTPNAPQKAPGGQENGGPATAAPKQEAGAEGDSRDPGRVVPERQRQGRTGSVDEGARGEQGPRERAGIAAEENKRLSDRSAPEVLMQAVGDGTPHPSQHEIPPTAQTVTIVEPARNPAIQRNADLLPEIPDDARLPSHVVEFPNPMAIKDATGEVRGRVDKLYDHQREGAERILAAWQQRDGVILSDSAGLGKTNTALAAIVANGGKRNLIVVPTRGKEGLKEQWAGPGCAGLYGIKMRGVDDLHATEDGTYIVSYDELMAASKDPETGKRVTKPRPELFDGRWDSVTFDESHTMVNAKSQAAAAGKALQERAGKVAYLSATPFTDLSDMHYLTKLGLFGAGPEEFTKWATIAGGDVSPKGKVRNPRSWLPMAAIAAVMHVDGLSVRRLTSLEGMSSQFSELEMPEHARETFQLAEQVCEIAGQMGTEGTIARMLYTSWARQYWETLKVDDAIKVGQKAIKEGKQVAFFCSYKTAEHKHMAALPAMMRRRADKLMADDDPRRHAEAQTLIDAAERCEALIGKMAKPVNPIDALRDAFGGGKDVAEIHGNTTKKPGAEQRAYQSGKKKVVVATMARGGTGISLHDTSGTAPRVQVNLSLPWSGREFDQVAGRSHRLGSKSETTMHWLLGAHDNEKHNAAVVARRLKSMGSLTSGDPALNPDAHALARWEIAKNRPDDDDIDAEIKTMVEQAEAIQELADAGGDEDKTDGRPVDAEAEETRDYFEEKLREFAEARKAGRDILRELYDTATIARAKRTHLEERRAAAQLEAVHGWRIEHNEGGTAVLHARYNEAHIAKIKNQGGHWDAYRRVWTIDTARLPRLARAIGVHEHKVDMHEVARKTAEKAKAGEAAGPASAAPDHATIAAALRDRFGLHLVPVPGWSGGVGIVGKTYEHKDTIKPHASGFRDLGPSGKGWVIHQGKLAALHAALTSGGGVQKSLRFVVRRRVGACA